MYLAVEFGAISGESLVQNVVAAALYFVVGALVLAAGFGLMDLLTPGSLRHLVFVEYRPNAVLSRSHATMTPRSSPARTNSVRDSSTPPSTASSGCCCRGWRWWCSKWPCRGASAI